MLILNGLSSDYIEGWVLQSMVGMECKDNNKLGHAGNLFSQFSFTF